MTKQYTHDEIRALLDGLSRPVETYQDAVNIALLETDFKIESPAIIRQLLAEIKELQERFKDADKEGLKYLNEIDSLKEYVDGYLEFIDEQERTIEDLDDKRETAVRMLRQQEKRIAEFEKLIAAFQKDRDEYHPKLKYFQDLAESLERNMNELAEQKMKEFITEQFTPTKAKPIEYVTISKDGKKMFYAQGDRINEIDLDEATKNDPGARAYFGLDDG